jgi:hypothetical protein
MEIRFRAKVYSTTCAVSGAGEDYSNLEFYGKAKLPIYIWTEPGYRFPNFGRLDAVK